MSYASEISCMSPYSIPLWTILTKLPAPPGPTYMVQGPVFIFIFFEKKREKKVSFYFCFVLALSPQKKKTSLSFSLTIIHLRRHFRQHGLQSVESALVPSRHHRRAVSGPLLPAGDPHADVPHALFRDLGRAALGVLVPLVASVDDDVARLEPCLEEAGDGAVDGGSRLDEDDHAAGE